MAKFGAIIIDNRPSLNLDPILKKHVPFLPTNWEVIHYDQFPITTGGDYNLLLTNADFWRQVPFDKVLVFQHDSELFRKGIEDFLEYDIIGAPLYHIQMPAMNGGLSLRSKDKMIAICEQFPWNPNLGNEDIYFCQHMERVGGKLPTKEVAERFAVETIYGFGSMGAHAIDKWHTPDKCEALRNQYKNPIISEEFKKACTGGDLSQHMGTIRDLAAQCAHVTEFGVGASTWAFLEAECKSITTYDLEEKECLTKLIKAGVKFKCENVLTANIDKTELLMIDTYGCYSQLSTELERHHKQVQKYIVIHDTVAWGHQDEKGGWVVKNVALNYKDLGKYGLIPAIHDFLNNHPEWSVIRHDLNNNGLTVLSRKKIVRKLYTSFYQDANPERQAEYAQCLAHNIMNPLIDKIFIIADQNYPELQHRKIIPIITPERPKYSTFFSLVNETIGDDEIAIISNTDIHFNKTLGLVSCLPNTCLALSRWDDDTLHHERFSQDVWIYQGKIKPGIYGDFYLGIRGCDNRICAEIKKAGYNIINPCLSVQTMHVHKSGIRNYGLETVPRPYWPVEICTYLY